MAELKTKAAASDIVFRDGTSAESGTNNVRYIPHLIIIDGEGKALETYDSSRLSTLHREGTLAQTINDKAVSFRE